MSTFERGRRRRPQEWFDEPRFAGITRLYSARQVVEQRGTIRTDYTVAREAAAAFYERLRQLFAERKSITTFGPYSPGQAVTMKRMGIEGDLPRRLGDLRQRARSAEDPGPISRAIRSARCPTRRPRSCAPCSPPTATSSFCARA